jgi:hypothetical protein
MLGPWKESSQEWLFDLLFMLEERDTGITMLW